MAATDDYNFKKFNYYIAGTFAEFLNDIQQHSYKKLTDTWWRTCYTELKGLIYNPDTDTKEIQKKILDMVLAEFPKTMLTDEQITALTSELSHVYKAYDNFVHPVHYCGDRDCDWDCGVLSCGCIDCCRGRCGMRDW